METPRTQEQDALRDMEAALETIRYTVRSTYGNNNNAAQRVRRIGEEMREAMDALKLDYYDRH